MSNITNNIKNTKARYGWLSIVLHWLLAIVLIGMYFGGDYMVDLSYYDTWYHRAPNIHKEVGIVIGVLMVFRLLWNMFQIKPEAIGDDKAIVKLLAKLTHHILYLLVFVAVTSGYLISTSKGKGVNVFDFFEVPALFSIDAKGVDFIGLIHEWTTFGFILLVGVHAGAAFLHHFLYKDNTLKRMLRVQSKSE